MPEFIKKTYFGIDIEYRDTGEVNKDGKVILELKIHLDNKPIEEHDTAMFYEGVVKTFAMFQMGYRDYIEVEFKVEIVK